MSLKLSWTTEGKGALAQVRAAIKHSKAMHIVMHDAARSALYQVIVHKNSTPMMQLIDGLLNSSIHVKGLVEWVSTHGKVTVSQDKNKKTKITYSKDYAQQAEAQATEFINGLSEFWVFAPPPSPFKGWDYDAELAKLNAKAADYKRALDEGTLKIKGEVVELTDEDKAKIKLGSYSKPKILVQGTPPQGLWQ